MALLDEVKSELNQDQQASANEARGGNAAQVVESNEDKLQLAGEILGDFEDIMKDMIEDARDGKAESVQKNLDWMLVQLSEHHKTIKSVRDEISE